MNIPSIVNASAVEFIYSEVEKWYKFERGTERNETDNIWFEQVTLNTAISEASAHRLRIDMGTSGTTPQAKVRMREMYVFVRMSVSSWSWWTFHRRMVNAMVEVCGYERKEARRLLKRAPMLIFLPILHHIVMRQHG